MHTDLSSQMACLTASFTLPQRKLSHSRARGALRVQAVKVRAPPGRWTQWRGPLR